VLEALRRGYAQALRDVFILGLACACLTTLPSCATEWLNITRESQRRKELQEESDKKGEQVQPQEETDVNAVEIGTSNIVAQQEKGL
jgi:hypothetical protein